MRVFYWKCSAEIEHHKNNFNCCFKRKESGGIFSFIKENVDLILEEITGDKQAMGYLHHIKIDSQSKFFQRFVSKSFSDPNQNSKTILDLGCGLGPTIKILANQKY